MNLSVYTIGGGDLLQEVFNAIATVFNSKTSIHAITGLAVMFGGVCSLLEFSRSRDVTKLIKWLGLYIVVTSLVLYPKASVVIEDRSGIDIKPRIIDNVPLSLAIFASFTSSIGIGISEIIETVFHMPDDLNYNQTGMLMGSKLVVASRDFQITDPEFSQTLNEFMQQCVFYDLLLRKYTISDLTHHSDPWRFIKENTSVARAFPLDGQITVCNEGAAKLDKRWHDEINNAASIYGGQVMGGGKQAATTLISRLSEGYGFLTNVSAQGEEILKTNLIANAMSQALAHYGANANAPAALSAYLDTKTELQIRQTFSQSGMQAGIWMQEFTNILQAVIYSMFILVYFLSYSPFGVQIIKNYLMGMFLLQSFAPMYAIINFAATYYAQGRSMAFLASDTTHSTLSINNIMGVTQANADAMAIAGYLIWPVTIGGAMMLWRGMPSAIQSLGQYVGGVAQNTASHIAAEAVGGNISVGNSSFGNHSYANTNANHFDTNARFAGGMASWQTGTGSTVSITPQGTEILDSRNAVSNMGVSLQIADSLRAAISKQAQVSYGAAINQSQAAGEQYSAALRQMDDFGSHQSHFSSSGKSSSITESSGFSVSSHAVSQLVSSFAKEHNISHERAAQVLGQVYADTKIGGGFIAKAEAGASISASASARSAFGSLYNDGKRFSEDHNFGSAVDAARRSAIENHYRDGSDDGIRYAQSISSSFDKGDNFRTEAASSLTKATNFSSMASDSQDNSSSVIGNYTQEFYEWMRAQPNPMGGGMMSKSAIDNMNAHDPSLMQSYANQFIHEKTADIQHTFDQSHHLTNGAASIKNDYQSNNRMINGSNHIHEQYGNYQSTVDHQKNMAKLTSVDHLMESKTDSDLKQNINKLKSAEISVKTEAKTLEGNVKNKVSGQILGSLSKDKGSHTQSVKADMTESIFGDK